MNDRAVRKHTVVVGGDSGIIADDCAVGGLYSGKIDGKHIGREFVYIAPEDILDAQTGRARVVVVANVAQNKLPVAFGGGGCVQHVVVAH